MAWFDVQAKLLPFNLFCSIILAMCLKNYNWW
jgi:hypothetical protein